MELRAPNSLAKLLGRKEGVGEASAAESPDHYFLPNFCNGAVVLNVVVIAQMAAFVITLLSRRIFANVFVDLAVISVFVQWVALASAAALCLVRGYLARLPNWRALLMAYLMLLSITVVVGEAGLWIASALDVIGTPRPEWYSHFHVQNLAVSAIINALVLRYFLAKHELKQRTLSEARAKIQVLQSRIRPHFLFSSMNTVASLIRTAPSQAEAAIEDIADLVRHMLADGENLVPLKNEIEVARKYLGMESLRLDNRLRVEWDIGKYPRKAAIPMLSLQPILENAIYYGVEPSVAGGTVKISLWEADGTINIEVLTWLPPGGATRPDRDQDAALESMRQRLESYYGAEARMKVARDQGEYRITVSLPARGGK